MAFLILANLSNYLLTWNPGEEKNAHRTDYNDWPGHTLGLAPAVRLHFGKLKLVGQVGAYLWKEKKSSQKMYETVGFEYQL